MIVRPLARATFAVAVGALGLAAAGSCLLYDSSLLLPAPPAEADAADANGSAADAGCALARWPDRPLVEDVPGDGEIEFVNALRTVDYGVGRDGGVPRTFGLDLDGRCTCLSDVDLGAPSCRPRGDAGPECDLDDGRDSTAASLIERFSAFSDAFSQEAVNQSLADGYYGLLIRVRRYSGLPDDPRVEVAIFNSIGNDGIQDGGAPKRPRHDGTDRWTVDPASVKGGVGPPYVPIYVDANAYVAHDRLVATLDFPITFSGLPEDGVTALTVDLKGSVLVGTIARDGEGGYRIDDGTLAGRWPASRLLTALEVLPDPFDPARGLCGDSGAYTFVKALVCDGQDVVADLRQDNTSAPCDAISVSVAFTAGPAELGDVVAPPPPAKLCGPQWRDDCQR